VLNLLITVVVNAMQSRCYAVDVEPAQAAHAKRVSRVEEVRAVCAEIRAFTGLSRRR
jgi:hypothetical protein